MFGGGGGGGTLGGGGGGGTLGGGGGGLGGTTTKHPSYAANLTSWYVVVGKEKFTSEASQVLEVIRWTFESSARNTPPDTLKYKPVEVTGFSSKAQSGTMESLNTRKTPEELCTTGLYPKLSIEME